MSGVCLCVCCCLDHWRWWQRQSRDGRINIRKTNKSSRLAQQRRQHVVVNVLEEERGLFPQGPLPKATVVKMVSHLSPSIFCYPRKHYSSERFPCPPSHVPWHTSVCAACTFNLCYKNTSCNIALSHLQYFELQNQYCHGNYVLGSQRYPMAQRKPKVSL